MAIHPQPQPQFAGLQPYLPGLPIEALAARYSLDPARIIKLASNENPYGMSPHVSAGLANTASAAFRYPVQSQLVAALAEKHRLSIENVVVGNGSNDVLDLAARAFLGPGRAAVSSQYAFSIYGILTTLAGADNVVVPAGNYGHDLDAMLAAITPATSVVWIANPNNPTGTFVGYNSVRTFLERVPSQVLVVLDEAYYEYLDPADRAETPAWLVEYPNLVLTRTFSKIHGLAGLRVGYGLAAPPIIELLNQARQPFNVNVLGMEAALLALADQAFAGRSYRHNQADRRRLAEGLAALGLQPLPAYGNFVTVAVPDGAHVNNQLLHRGIIVRPLAEYGLPDHLRISVGTPAEIQALLAALSDVISDAADLR